MTGRASPTTALTQAGTGIREAEDAHLERQQEHDVEQQHQPRRVAEELGHEPAAGPHRTAQRRAGQPERQARSGAERHRQNADQQVEQEAAEHERQPFQQDGKRVARCIAAGWLPPARPWPAAMARPSSSQGQRQRAA